MGVLWQRSGTIERDNNDARAPGALAYFYVGSTTTPYPVYEDADESTAHDHPVEADGNGRWPTVFIPFGTYKLVVKTAGGTTLSSADDIPNPAPVDTSESVDANAIFQTGDTILSFKNGTRAGFVRWNGRSIGNAASSATERANADTEALFAVIWDNSLDAQCAVSGGRGASAAADYAAGKRITLPDVRNASVFGFGDMGNTDAGLMASAPVVSGSPILAGSIIGANTHALTEAQLASHTHTGTTGTESQSHTHSGTTASEVATHTHSGTTLNQNADHTHNYDIPLSKVGQASGFTATGGQIWHNTGGATATSSTSATHAHDFTTGTQSTGHTHTFTSGNTSVTHTHSFTSASTGSGTAHNIVSRGVPVTVLMKL